MDPANRFTDTVGFQSFTMSSNPALARRLFCLWTGTNAMSTDRIQSLWSILNHVAVPLVFINHLHLRSWEIPSAPLHPAFDFLSATHKSDYLRCYLMHHHGGGYTDIKRTSQAWGRFFDRLQASEHHWALGYRELPYGMPHLDGTDEGRRIQADHAQLIGLCAFIFKPHTPLTEAWLGETEALLDRKLADLKAHPAQHPMDQTGVRLPDGTPSPYPLAWAELLGNIFHTLIHRHRDRLLQDDIAPQFTKYR
jgi:hypothetical protein